METTTKKIINAIRKISKTKLSDKKILSAKYLDLDKGLIDSLQIVELINELEKIFKIRFSSADLQSRKFMTVQGLSEIIGEKGRKIKQ